MNRKWETFGSEFYRIFENYDLNEESRFQFVKFNVSQVTDLLSELYMSVGDITANLSQKVYLIGCIVGG